MKGHRLNRAQGPWGLWSVYLQNEGRHRVQFMLCVLQEVLLKSSKPNSDALPIRLMDQTFLCKTFFFRNNTQCLSVSWRPYSQKHLPCQTVGPFDLHTVMAVNISQTTLCETLLPFFLNSSPSLLSPNHPSTARGNEALRSEGRGGVIAPNTRANTEVFTARHLGKQRKKRLLAFLKARRRDPRQSSILSRQFVVLCLPLCEARG